MADMKGRDFLKMLDFTAEEITALLDMAADFKEKKQQGLPHRIHEGKNIALIFEKTSTRTRCAFEVAARDLGIGTTFLGSKDSQVGVKESIADTARVLASMYDAIEYRGFEHEIVETLAVYSDKPVINGLTAASHPTQILADLLTIREHFGRLSGIKLVFMGDAGYNMANSLMIGCARMGMHFVACAPEAYFPDAEIVAIARELAEESGGSVELITDPEEAVQGADVVYTDIWVSMGEPEDMWNRRIIELSPYQVNQQIMEIAGPQARFMHCLPAYHNKETKVSNKICTSFNVDALEVTEEVFEGSQSIVFDEAENRLHTIKAVLAAVL